MQKAIELAETALNNGELPIASVLVLNNEIVASAYTTEKRDRRYLVHAELNALLAADKLDLSYKDRQKCVLYTTLEPCMMCLGACMSFFLGEIHYALESAADGAVNMAQQWHRKEDDLPGYKLPKLSGGNMRRESVDLFKRYTEIHESGPMREWAKSLADL